MKKPYLKQKPFYAPSSVPAKSPAFLSDADLSVDEIDRVAAFETLRVYEGRIFRLAEHMERLEASCESIGRVLPFPQEQIAGWLKEELKLSAFQNATLRISVHHRDDQSGFLLLMAREFLSHPAIWYESGVSVRTTVSQRWTLKAQDPQVKASQYVSGVLAFLDKGDLAAHELVFLSNGGMVAEGTVSNLFILKKKTLLTPSLSSGILKGVTRGFVIDLARKRQWAVRETMLTRHDFYSADECFLTNTSSEILPIIEMDGRSIGAGSPGPLTQTLAADFKKCLFIESKEL